MKIINACLHFLSTTQQTNDDMRRLFILRRLEFLLRRLGLQPKTHVNSQIKGTAGEQRGLDWFDLGDITYDMEEVFSYFADSYIPYNF